LKPHISISQSLDDWPGMATEAIQKAVDLAISDQGVCNLMLTGGTTAERLYRHWSQTAPFAFEKIHFSFGDERCVPPDHPESNYALVKGILPNLENIVRMEAENPDKSEAAESYSRLIPETVDVLLLGMGEDGHIASLFPMDPVLRSEARGVMPITGPKAPYERLTITPEVVKQARRIFVLATGANKGKTLDKALDAKADYFNLPVRLALKAVWLLDNEAGSQIRTEYKNNSLIQDYFKSHSS